MSQTDFEKVHEEAWAAPRQTMTTLSLCIQKRLKHLEIDAR